MVRAIIKEGPLTSFQMKNELCRRSRCGFNPGVQMARSSMFKKVNTIYVRYRYCTVWDIDRNNKRVKEILDYEENAEKRDEKYNAMNRERRLNRKTNNAWLI